jgi:hypothetical protein
MRRPSPTARLRPKSDGRVQSSGRNAPSEAKRRAPNHTTLTAAETRCWISVRQAICSEVTESLSAENAVRLSLEIADAAILALRAALARRGA